MANDNKDRWYTLTTSDGKDHKLYQKDLDEYGWGGYAKAYPEATVVMSDPDGGLWDVDLREVGEKRKQGYKYKTTVVVPAQKPQPKQTTAKPAAQAPQQVSPEKTTAQEEGPDDNIYTGVDGSIDDDAKRSFEDTLRSLGVNVKTQQSPKGIIQTTNRDVEHSRRMVDAQQYEPNFGLDPNTSQTDLNPFKTDEEKREDSYISQAAQKANISLAWEHQIDEELTKAGEQLDKVMKRIDSETPFIQQMLNVMVGDKGGGYNNPYEQDAEYQRVLTRINQLRKAKEYNRLGREVLKNNDYEKDNSFSLFSGESWERFGKNAWTGIKSAGTNVENIPVLGGLQLMRDMSNKAYLAHKINTHQKLTPEDQDLLTAFTLADFAENKNSFAKGNWGYIAGSGGVQMLSFMVELATSPSSTLSRGLAGKATTYVSRKLIRKFGTEGVRKIATKVLTYAAQQGARVTGAVVNGGIVTPLTTQLPKTAAKALSRNAGTAVGDIDEQGELTGQGFEGGQDAFGAFRDAILEQGIENVSEEILAGIGAGKGIGKLMKSLGFAKGGAHASKFTSSLVDYLTKADDVALKGPVAKWRAAGKFGSPIEEILEEYAAIPMQHAAGLSEYNGTALDEMTDPETFYNIVAGLSLGMGFMEGTTLLADKGGKAAVKGVNNLVTSRRLNKSDIAAQNIFGADWGELKETIESYTDDGIGAGISSLMSTFKDEKEKQAVWRYLVDLQAYRGANLARQKSHGEDAKNDFAAAHEEALEKGYSTTEALSRINIKKTLDYLSEKDGALIEEGIEYFGSAEALIRNMEEWAKPEDIQQVMDYLNAKAMYEGVVTRISDDMEGQIDAMNHNVDSMTNQETGVIETVTLDENKAELNHLDPSLEYHNVSGEIITLEDGSIDYLNSSKNIILQDSKGKKHFVPIDAISGISSTIAPDDLRSYLQGRIEAQYAEKLKTGEEGKAPFAVGDLYTFNDGTWQVQSNNEDIEGGKITFYNTETGEVRALTREEAQKAFDAEANIAIAEANGGTPTATPEEANLPEGRLQPTPEEVLSNTEGGRMAMQQVDEWMQNDPDEVESNINDMIPEQFREAALAYYQAKTNPQTTGEEVAPVIAPQTEQPETVTPAPQAAELPRNEDGEFDVKKHKKNADADAMAQALVSEFGNEGAMDVAQGYRADALNKKTKRPEQKIYVMRDAAYWADVISKLNELNPTAPVAPQQPAGQPPTTPNVGGENARAKWDGAQKVEGRTAQVRLKDGRKVKGHFVVAPAGVATASHTANFQDNLDFIHDASGRSMNPRDYTQPTNQASVSSVANDYQLQNYQIVSEDGIVYDGNGRQIAGDIAARQGTDGKYIEDLVDNADMYGIDASQLEGMEHPRLYFQVDEGQLDYSPQTFDMFNASEQKEVGAVEQGTAMAMTVTDQTFNTLANIIAGVEGGLKGVYRSAAAQREVITAMQEASDIKEVNQQTRPRYFNDADGTLTEAGRILLESALVGKLFGKNADVIQMLSTMPRVRNAIAQAMPDLLENNKLGEYSLIDEVAQAIQAIYSAAKAGQTLQDYMLQGDLFEGKAGKEVYGATVELMANILNGDENVTLQEVLAGSEENDGYNKKASTALNYGSLLFGDNRSREEIITEIIESINPELAKKYGIRKQAESAGEQTPVVENGSSSSQGEEAAEQPGEVGPFGRIYRQFKGKAKEAIAFLRSKKSGEAVGALHHEEIGDIDLVWGEEGTGKSDGFGLAKLVKYHPEVLDHLQEILDDMRVVQRSENRAKLESNTHRAVVRLTWDAQKKNWLLTAFEKKETSEPTNSRTDVDSNLDGKSDDTATRQDSDVSESKNTEKSGNAQENSEKNTPQDNWRFELHYDRETGRVEITREKVGPSGIPIRDGRWKITAKSLAEMRGILENPANNLKAVYDQVEARLHNEEQLEALRKEEQQAKQEESTETAPQAAESTLSNGRTAEENARLEELKARLHKKLFGQLNSGFDPELFAIGAEIAFLHIKGGLRKFDAFARQMIADFGDTIRPLLKSFYNGARDFPGMEEYQADMTPSEDVAKFDVANFDKSVPDIMVGAEVAVNERKVDQAAKEIEEASVRKEADAEKYRAFSQSVAADMLAAMEMGEKPYKSIKDIRAKAKSLGLEIDDNGRDDILLQELVEDGLVNAARKYVSQYLIMAALGSKKISEVRKSKALFDEVVRLYELQPTISQRSSNRIKMQQYSTPLPMSFIADMFAFREGMHDVLEPTAGNGMLVFAIPESTVHANELDKTRLDNLRAQKFKKVTDQDATQPFEGEEQYDAVITNPPFGSTEAKEYDGKLISGLAPQIALNALAKMKDDGKAAIIIGGEQTYAKNGSIVGDKQFLTYLYDHYNVKGVVEMSGKLYAKQGTVYPTRLILIDGRRSEAEREQTKVYPPRQQEALRKAESFDDLYEIVNEVINSNDKTNGHEVLRSAGAPQRTIGVTQSGQLDLFGDTGQSNANDTNGRDGGKGTSVSGRSNSGNRGNEQGGVSSTPKQGSTRVSGLEPTAVHGGARDTGGNAVGTRGGNISGGERTEGDTRGSRSVDSGNAGRVQLDGAGKSVAVGQPGARVEQKPKEQRKLDQEKLPYRPHNTAFSLESVAPAAMVESMDATLAEIEKEVGDIDNFVRSELGYDTVEELHDALAAEQVDSVAMAIYQMKKGNAVVIGDQTGVGKGRQMAALIRWACKRGQKPVFITKDANLFSDIYRDLVDIGSGDLRPFIFNAPNGDNPGVMTDKDGNVVYRALDKTAQSHILAGDKLPNEYDYAVLSYSQVNTGDAQSREEARQKAKKNGGRAKKKDDGKGKPTPKADFLRKIAKGNIMLLDESHTAAGESNTGAYLQSLVKDSAAVTFASATFAKRPDTMPLYALRTAMSEANVEADKLIGIIEKGGVTLQEIMSRALSECGQMVRRERDMSDVQTDWKTVADEETVKRARDNYDRTIKAFNAIIQFQEMFVAPKVAEADADMGWMGGTADLKQGTKKGGIDNPPFVNKTYNYTKQLLLALKVDAIVDEVEAEIKAGRHPVIALESTMESSLSDFSVGETIDEPTFALSLLRGLDTVMQYTVKDEDGNETHATYSPSELGPEGERAYYALQQFIRESTQGIFISPLDAIIEKLNARGYKVGELTGRKTYLEKNSEGKATVKNRGKIDKKKLARDFNNGALDVLILNKSASTGISLHASKKFPDQRQRTMIIAQPLSDINDYMQMIGRIDRTGQVRRGYYINLGLPVPAESRFLMMLSTKLKSLNANTTTSQDSESNDVEAPDLLNKYGAQVIIEYLRDNPDIYEKMGMPLGKQSEPVKPSELEDYKPKEEDANRITGRVALLSTAEQDAFYDEVVKRYNDLIKYLNETGTNDLKITVLPLRAKTLGKKISSEGKDPNGKNPFAGNAYVEAVEMDVLRKPMKADEVRKVVEQLSTPKGTPKARLPFASQERMVGDRTLEIIATIESETRDKMQAEEERYARDQEKVEEGIRKKAEKINASTKATAEEKQAAIETFATEQRNKLQEGHESRVNAISNLTQSFTNRLTWFHPGQTYLVPDDLEKEAYLFTSPAVFCGYKVKDSKITPSTTFAVFATLDGRRRIEVKMSQLGPLTHIKGATDNNLDAARQTNLDNWDSQIPANTRKKGYIMTGNILQAVQDTRDMNGNYPGQLISFTDENGNVRDGILMPEAWTPGKLATAGAPIMSRIEQIKDLTWRDAPIISTDGKIQIERDRYGDYFLRVPKSKKEGGQYYLNDELLGLVRNNGFFTRGGTMTAEVYEGNIEEVVKILSNMGIRVSVESDDKMDDNVRLMTSTELDELYPTWLSGQTTDTGQHTTQITSTVKSYENIGVWMLLSGRLDAKILDASSGLGVGTKALRDRGFDVDDVEPYPSENREAPTYRRYEDVKGKYDVVISNAVLNVIPDDWRADVLKSMADKLKVGGKLIINVRDAKSIESQKQKIELDRPSEILVTDKNGNIRAYQKGFTKQELKEYVESELGEGWKVEIANERNSGLKSGTAVVVTRETQEAPEYRAMTAENVTELPKRTDEELRQLRETCESWSKLTGVKINAVESFEELPEGIVRDMVSKGQPIYGWFEQKSGKVYVCLPFLRNEGEANVTILHELIAHRGLRELLGLSEFNRLCDLVWDAMSEESRKAFIDYPGVNGNTRAAADEYMAHIAEVLDIEPSVWTRIVGAIRHWLRSHGIDLKLTDGDIQTALRASLQMYLENGRRRSMEDNIGGIIPRLSTEYRVWAPTLEEEGLRLSASNTPANAANTNTSIREAYDKLMRSARLLSKETLIDYLASVEKLQGIIEKKIGQKLIDTQNVYKRMFSAIRKSEDDAKFFTSFCAEPLYKAIFAIAGNADFSTNRKAERLDRYCRVKHGIERNRDMAALEHLDAEAQREFSEQMEAELSNLTIQAANLTVEINDLIAQREDAKSRGDRLRARDIQDQINIKRESLRAVNAERNGKMRFPEKYGLKSLQTIKDEKRNEWYDAVESERARCKAAGLSWRETQEALDALATDDFGITLGKEYAGVGATLAAMGENNAYDFVERFEDEVGEDRINALWDAIRLTSGVSLEKQLNTGLVDKDYVAEQQRRYEYYVPLRGFKGVVASDVYDYPGEGVHGVGNPVIPAGGRESEADNCFGNLLSIGYRSISCGNHNQALQALWNLARSGKSEGLLIGNRMWIENIGTDEEPDWVMAEAEIPANATAAEVAEILEAFEKDMKEKQKVGLAMQKYKGTPLPPYRTLNKAEKNAHHVYIYIGGELRVVTVVGNPRVALALNGVLNPENTSVKMLRGLNNFLSGAFTSDNPSFAAANLVRDTLHSNARVFITENPRYWAKFTAKQAGYGLVGASLVYNWGKMMNLLQWYGTYQQSGKKLSFDQEAKRLRFKGVSGQTLKNFARFMELGGATGYIWAKDDVESLREIESALSDLAHPTKTTIKKYNPFRLFEFASEASELVNRFIAFETSLGMGKTELQAVSDAQELTLNFTRKGAGSKTAKAMTLDTSKMKMGERAKRNTVAALAHISQFGRNHIVFWNAHMQGAYQLKDMLWKHPVKTTFAYVGVPMTMAGILQPLMNNLLLPALYAAFGLGGDDDDDKKYNYYDELPDYIRQRNVCIRKPGGGWFLVPLTPELASMWSIGDAMGGVEYGRPLKTSEVILPLLDAVSPTTIDWSQGMGGVFVGATPTGFQPVAHILTNRDWKGQRIKNETPWNEGLPEWKRTFNGTSPTLLAASKGLNEMIGGDNDTYVCGAININPGTMKELIQGYLGGFGTSTIDLCDYIYGAADKEAEAARRDARLPIIGRFWLQGTKGQINQQVQSLYYDRVADFHKSVQTREREMRKALSEADNNLEGIKEELANTSAVNIVKYEELEAEKKKFEGKVSKCEKTLEGYYNSDEWQKYLDIHNGVTDLNKMMRGKKASDLSKGEIDLMKELIEEVSD